MSMNNTHKLNQMGQTLELFGGLERQLRTGPQVTLHVYKQHTRWNQIGQALALSAGPETQLRIGPQLSEAKLHCMPMDDNCREPAWPGSNTAWRFGN